MLSIETISLFITIALIFGGGIFLLHRYANSTTIKSTQTETTQTETTQTDTTQTDTAQTDTAQAKRTEIKDTFKNCEAAAIEYLKRRIARRKKLESCANRTTDEEEELLILRELEIHENILCSESIPTMVSILSPMMQTEKEKYQAMMKKKYGISIPDGPNTLSRTPNMMRWELVARAAAAAEIGSLFCYLTNLSFPDETEAISYVILRVDQPNRWKHFEITHRMIEDLPTIVRQHIGGPCSDLILLPKGSIVDFIWKPISTMWERII
jgi:hypothetical protein